MFNHSALSVRPMDYFYNVNIHDALHVLNKKKKTWRVIFNRLAKASYRCPNNFGRGGRGLDPYVLGSQNTEPALLQLIYTGVEERRKKEKNP